MSRQTEFSILTILGNSAVIDGQLADANAHYERCLEICTTLNLMRGYAVVYGNLGHLHERLGDYEAAHEFALKSFDTFIKLNDWRNLAGSIAGAASGYWVAGDYETAAEVLGCAYAVWETGELVPDTIDLVTAERWRERVHQKLGDARFKAAFEAGKRVPTTEIVERLLAHPQPWE